MKPEAITVQRLQKRFGQVRAVAGLNVTVPVGAFLVLLGPSGCGKTTVLRMLAGLEEPSGGEIWFGDRLVASGARGIIVPPGQRNVGLVFQSYALWPHMTVTGNVEWPLKVARWAAAERRLRVQEVLDLVGVADLAGRYPSEISGGQQQRVAIARTLAPRPTILLLDEPLSNLDARLRVEMRSELLRIHRSTGATTVYVTHDQVEALTLATHVAVMHDGTVEQFGPPLNLLEAPATTFVATFIGTPPGNLLRAAVRDGRFRLGGLDLGPGPSGADGRDHWLFYRPDTIRVCAEPGERRLSLRFAEATPVAGRSVVTGWYEGQRLSAVTDRPPEARVDDAVFFELPPVPAGVYDEAGRRTGTT